MSLRILVRGGGDLASGVIVRLHRAGWQVLVTELAQPSAVRRTVSFAQAVYSGKVVIEGVEALQVMDFSEVNDVVSMGKVAVVVDPLVTFSKYFLPDVVVDARMMKVSSGHVQSNAQLVIGLGPGFIAGVDCDAIIETNRGHNMGRVIWDGSAEMNSGIPEGVDGYRSERVLRAPCDGLFQSELEIGERVNSGKVIGWVKSKPIESKLDGVIRGLVQDGIFVQTGMKVGDIDPRGDPSFCSLVSDKALAVGGGVLEAILSTASLREKLSA